MHHLLAHESQRTAVVQSRAMEGAVASLLRSVGEECRSIDARSGTRGVWLWEQRLTLRADSNQRQSAQLDGGLRHEGPNQASFIVAADPIQLTDPRASGPREIGWAALANLLRQRLAAELSHAGGVGTVSGRTRLLVAQDQVWVDQVSSGVAPPEVADSIGSTLLPPAFTNRLVFGPSAAGWLGHELGHRAIEGGRRDWPPGMSLIDDPTQAPWPAGFEVDDLGHQVGPIDLLRSPPFRRRASIRNGAVPSMSFTRLDSSAGLFDPSSLGDSLRVDRIRAGRYDVPTDSILLETDRVYLPGRETGFQRVDSPMLLVITSQALSTLAKVAGEGEVEVGSALCTRHESLIPVMVGAPTITLDCVQLIPLNSPKGQGNPGVQR